MTPAGPGRPRDADADAAILTAALELFIERGADGTSFEQVAKRAGVAKLTVYRRWSSKEDLLVAAVESAVQDVEVPSAEDAAAVPLPDLIERVLPAAVDAVTDPDYPAMIAQALGSAVRYPRLMAAYWERHILPRRRILRAMLERAKDEDRLPADTDAEVLVDMIVGAVMYRVLQPGPFEPAEARRYLRALYRNAGLLPGEER
ncbi:TetR/AcrR family transcriptional regulator [Streptomonospora sp. PA3]|uniref:TetR/AcrR family transcriptional regulator n=1 Tax=Streptomonospora sp. PA3 TaxID=2607326 RepID=UPI0012DDD2B4|nr:TetR/AcrR family transcriptional regulator [Streptomonospora sp. PA3]MUL41771.1 TetR/AcrR family transcriptional regulator [Streptomonospora sp. PA3]